jgi:hypothetical protein
MTMRLAKSVGVGPMMGLAQVRQKKKKTRKSLSHGDKERRGKSDGKKERGVFRATKGRRRERKREK